MFSDESMSVFASTSLAYARKLFMFCVAVIVVLLGTVRLSWPSSYRMEVSVAIGRRELQETIRQHEPWARQAVTDVALDIAQKALRAFAERGMLPIAKDREDALRLALKG